MKMTEEQEKRLWDLGCHYPNPNMSYEEAEKLIKFYEENMDR